MNENELIDNYISVTDATYDPVLPDLPVDPDLSIKDQIVDGLQSFYHSSIEGSLQIFHSLTLGEIMIAILLAMILIVFVFKWIWEVVRYG